MWTQDTRSISQSVHDEDEGCKDKTLEMLGMEGVIKIGVEDARGWLDPVM